jgi:cytochrome c oxidase assembly factor CtaG
MGRGLVAFVCIVSSWVLAVLLAMWPTPLYDYAHLASRPGGISALTDQQLAAGIMWGPGAVPLSVIVFVFGYRFLEDPERRRQGSEPRPVSHLVQEKGA